MLDTIALVGAIPERYHWDGTQIDLSLYFAMARGMVHDQNQDEALPAMEMTKWLNIIRQSFQPLLARADLPHIRFHDLRHSAATLLLTLDIHPKIVQELLGHSQIFVTLGIYSHILPTLQEEAMRQLHTALSDFSSKSGE